MESTWGTLALQFPLRVIPTYVLLLALNSMIFSPLICSFSPGVPFAFKDLMIH